MMSLVMQTIAMPSACCLCGHERGAAVFRAHGCTLWECARCGLLAVKPQPSGRAQDAFYQRPGYREAACGRGPVRDPRRLSRHLALVNRLGRGRLLDVGCGEGAFLHRAAHAGWEVLGVERSRQAAAYARRMHGLPVVCGDEATLPADAGPFDVVTMFDVIEHLPDPLATLRRLAGALRPGGRLVVSTPNAAGASPRLTYWLFCRTLGAWDHATPPGHLFQFTTRTLRALVERAGFECRSATTYGIPLAYSAGKLEESVVRRLRGPAPRHGTSTSASQVERTRRRAGQPSWPRRLVRAACWGCLASAHLVAAATQQGDSVVLVARKPVSRADQGFGGRSE